MSKQKLTLTIEDSLTEQMKILAVRLKRSVSDITEELYREFLKREGKPKK
jgi:predicted transcriptional regulator